MKTKKLLSLFMAASITLGGLGFMPAQVSAKSKSVKATVIKKVSKALTPQQKYISAFNKTANVTSVEQKASMTLNFKASGLSADEQTTFKEISPYLNNIKISSNGKLVKTSAKAMKSQSALTATVSGFPVTLNVWESVNASSAKQIIQIPDALKFVLSSDETYKDVYNLIKDKTYIYTDSATLSTGTTGSITPAEYAKISSLGEVLGQKINAAAMKAYQTYGSKFITYSKGKYYIKLNNTYYKQIVKYVMNDKAVQKAFADIIMADSQDTKLSASDLAQLNKAISSLLDSCSLTFNSTSTVNSAGYIASESGTIALSLNMGKLANIINSLDTTTKTPDVPNTKAIYTINISYSQQNLNINSKKLSVSLPKLTEANSISMDKLSIPQTADTTDTTTTK